MRSKDIINLLLLAAIWGSSYLFIKLVAPVIGVGLTLGTRVIIAAIFLSLLAMARGKFPSMKKYGWHYLFLGAFNLVFPTALVIISVMRLNASMGSILNATTPLFTMVIARIWLKEKLSLRRIAGLISGITGIIILVGWNPLPLTPYTLVAFICSIIAAVCYGIANVFSRAKFSQADSMQTASGQMIGAAILVAPVFLFESDPHMLQPGILVPLLILGIVCTALAFILFFRLVKQIGSLQVSMVTILVPVFGVLWSAVFLGEKMNGGMLAGLLFIIGGLVLVLTHPKKKRRAGTNEQGKKDPLTALQQTKTQKLYRYE